ncbi:hypothetical protein V8G54_011456 [Vigna mungo]|uniref:Retrotransposon gag domain-containing protein n=1 Tax=Vigna mungo TaxID=3915 RepID=A0AAQ3NP62_VIGMU
MPPGDKVPFTQDGNDPIQEIITSGKLSKLEHFEADEKIVNAATFRPVNPSKANLNILSNLSKAWQVMNSAGLNGGTSMGLLSMGQTLFVGQNPGLGSLSSNTSNLSSRSNNWISLPLGNLQGAVSMRPQGPKWCKVGVPMNQNEMSGLGPSKVSFGNGTTIPTPGMVGKHMRRRRRYRREREGDRTVEYRGQGIELTERPNGWKQQGSILTATTVRMGGKIIRLRSILGYVTIGPTCRIQNDEKTAGSDREEGKASRILIDGSSRHLGGKNECGRREIGEHEAFHGNLGGNNAKGFPRTDENDRRTKPQGSVNGARKEDEGEKDDGSKMGNMMDRTVLEEEEQLNWRKRVELPVFEGFDSLNWINRADKFFELQGVSEEEKQCRVLVQILEGADEKPNVNRTEEGNDGPIFERLAAIKQSGSVEEYIQDFEILVGQTKGVAKEQLMGYFMAGLQDGIRNQVRLLDPQELMTAIRMARDVEEIQGGVKRAERLSRRPDKRKETNMKNGGRKEGALDAVNSSPEGHDIGRRRGRMATTRASKPELMRSHEIKLPDSNLEDKVVLQRGVLLGYKEGGNRKGWKAYEKEKKGIRREVIVRVGKHMRRRRRYRREREGDRTVEYRGQVDRTVDKKGSMGTTRPNGWKQQGSILTATIVRMGGKIIRVVLVMFHTRIRNSGAANMRYGRSRHQVESLFGQRQGLSIFISKLEGYRDSYASETLAANWLSVMEIGRLISEDHMNNKQHVGKADFLVFLTTNPHGFLGQLQCVQLCNYHHRHCNYLFLTAFHLIG